MTLAEAQHRKLVEVSEASGRRAELLHFLALSAHWEAFHSLAPDTGAHADDRLAYALLESHIGACEPLHLLPLLPEAYDPWNCYTLLKCLLARDLAKEALEAAVYWLRERSPDPFLLNLIGKAMLQRADWDFAREMFRRSLALAPYQRDVIVLAEHAERRQPLPCPIHLDPLPKPRTIAFYIPAFNVERFMAAAINGLLAQSWPLAGLVVVDDGCTDDSIAIARGYPVRIVRHPENRGLAAARNTAFSALDCELVGAIDTDAVPDPAFARNAVMDFENAPDRLAGVGGRLIEAHTGTPSDLWRAVHLSQDPGTLRYYVSLPEPDGTEARKAEIALYGSFMLPLFGADTLLKRDAVCAIGGYDPSLRTNAEDANLADRLKTAGYHYAFSPHAVCRHLRRDTADSLLRTQWRYDLEHFERTGHFESQEKLILMAGTHQQVAADRLARDWDAGRVSLVYLSLCTLLYGVAQDTAAAVRRGALSPGGAETLHETIIHAFETEDARRNASLARRVRRDMALWHDTGGMAALPPEEASAAALEDFAGALRAWLQGLPAPLYNALEQAPGPEHNEDRP